MSKQKHSHSQQETVFTVPAAKHSVARRKNKRLAREQKKSQALNKNLDVQAENEWNTISVHAPPPLPSLTSLPPLKSKKRKAPHSTSAAKRSKKHTQVNLNSLDDWGWNEVSCPEGMLINDDIGGFLCLEEIDGIDIEYEGDDVTGKTLKFKRVDEGKKKTANKARPDEPLSIEETRNYFDLDTFTEESAAAHLEDPSELNTAEEDGVGNLEVNPVPENKTAKEKKLTAKQKKLEKRKVDRKVAQEEAKKALVTEKERENEFDADFDVSEWNQFNLSPKILDALKRLRFGAPTAIQEKALPHALEGRDVVGAAETGSGKTLAFGIPIVQYLASNGCNFDSATGLVLAPTRELAIQVRDHILALAKDVVNAQVIAIVGGMSIQKQHRMLRGKPDIIVATPGRLWELLSENEAYMALIRGIRFLAIDEADRMLEGGHFRELGYILEALSNTRKTAKAFGATLEQGEEEKLVASRQTFVFSATLSQDLQLGQKNKKKRTSNKPKSGESNGTINELIERIDFDDEAPVLVDVTESKGLAKNLKETQISCLKDEKDASLYAFLTRYPGRTLIFLNSIDAIRRLAPMLSLLGFQAYPLHAQMQQRQRLKNLDRFKSNKNCILVASDVAARGLDIPLVDHVIHYQVPRTTEIYIHRSGRTARASKEGISVLLVSPEEIPVYRKLCSTLNRPGGISAFPLDGNVLSKLKKRVVLARKIDEEEHKLQKMAHSKDWLRKNAEAMDIEIDEDFMGSDAEEDDDDQSSKERFRKSAHLKNKIANFRLELKSLIAEPLIPRGTSARYLTSSGVLPDLAERLMSSSRNQSLPAEKVTRAIDDA